MYNFTDVIDRRNNGSKKWNKDYIKKRFNIEDREDYYPLFIADMDYVLPKKIINSMKEIILEGDFGYFDVKEGFYDSTISWYKDRYKVNVKREDIVPSIGALSSMNLIVEKMFNKGDSILIFTPVYGPFKDVVENNKMNLVTCKLSLENSRYCIDFQLLENQIKDQKVKGIVLCNPHNPSGRCWDNEEIDKLIKICKDNDILIISDEVHGDLVINDNPFISLSSQLIEYKKIIVISSPNKTFNLAGLNISIFICKDKEIKEYLEKEFNNKKLHVNRLGCDFLTICYEKGGDWVDSLCENIKNNVDTVKDIVDMKEIELVTPDAGYLLWLKLSKVKNIDKFVLELAKETGVLLETGSRFVNDNEGFLRINVATSKEILVTAMNKFIDFYKKYREEANEGEIEMKREVIYSNNAPAAIGPYSHANKVGNVVYTSGQLPINPETKELITEIKAATRQSLENVKAILEEAGTNMSNVFKTTVVVKDLAQFADVNGVYSEYFGENSPARSCVQVAKLPMDAVVEIEVIATI